MLPFIAASTFLGEVVFLLIETCAYHDKAPHAVKTGCRGLMIVGIFCTAALLFLCLYVCCGLLTSGDTIGAMKLLVTAIILGIGLYVQQRRFLVRK